ncbi:hypothetical protein JMJ35_006079 [Cladonia borealis]|uniref:ACB domain-containing protein n=1 Tax=Cladonia borealis TaxID=184061 RepID=A0AA39R154_9LECA|nr:hypothetical protein JMJ35_006079 [Cladonia borealis]
MVTQSAEFEKAVKDSKKLQAKPTDDELLQLYALFKIGTGEDFAAATKPGSFDFKGKYKYNAWKKAVDEGTTPVDAQKQYVDLIKEFKGKYGFQE